MAHDIFHPYKISKIQMEGELIAWVKQVAYTLPNCLRVTNNSAYVVLITKFDVESMGRQKMHCTVFDIIYQIEEYDY